MNNIISKKKRKEPNKQNLVKRHIKKIAQICSKEAVLSLNEYKDDDGWLAAEPVNATCLERPGTKAKIDDLFDKIMEITDNHCVSRDHVWYSVYNSVWDAIAAAEGGRGYVDICGDDTGGNVIGSHYANAICETYEEILD